MRGVIDIIIGAVLVIGGVAGRLRLKFTYGPEGSLAVAAVGVLVLGLGIYRISPRTLRSILAVIIGMVVANVAITIMHKVSEMVFTPPADLKEEFTRFQTTGEMDKDKVREITQSMPIAAFAMVLLSWELGSFFGGAAAALIAGRARCVHAGFVGGFVLAATIAIVLMVPGHPNWLILAGLLLPLPVSLLGGLIVSMLLPKPPPAPPAGAIQAGEPPARPL